MATVYLARDLRHDRPVALKVLHPELAAALGPERFLREIKLAARLQHPHILTVLRLGRGGRAGSGSPCRTSRARACATGSARAAAPGRRRGADHPRGRRWRSTTPTGTAWSTATSSRRTSCWRTGRRWWPTSASPGRSSAGDERLTETGLVARHAGLHEPGAGGGRQGAGRPDRHLQPGHACSTRCSPGEPPFTGAHGAGDDGAAAARDAAADPRSVRETVPEGVAQAVARALAQVAGGPVRHRGRVRAGAGGIGARRHGRGRRRSGGPAPRVAARRRAAPSGRRGSRSPSRSASASCSASACCSAGSAPTARVEPTGPGTARLLAVLPFENLGDSTDEYFADGITDEVRGKLATLRGLKVIASSSAGQYKHSTKPPRADRAGAGRAVPAGRQDPLGEARGRAEPGAGEPRAGAGDAGRRRRPPGGSSRSTPSLTDVFQVQADIAGRVAQALDVALGDSARQRSGGAADPEPRRLRRLPEGPGGLQPEPATPARLRQAMSYFEQAVALDTTYAPAWARLSQAASFINFVGYADARRWSSGRASPPSGRWRWRRTGRKAAWRWATTCAGSSCDYAGAIEQYSQGERQSPVECRAVPRHRAGGADARPVGRGAGAPAPGPAAGPPVCGRPPRRSRRPALAETIRRGAGERRALARPRPGQTPSPTRPRR